MAGGCFSCPRPSRARLRNKGASVEAQGRGKMPANGRGGSRPLPKQKSQTRRRVTKITSKGSSADDAYTDLKVS